MFLLNKIVGFLTTPLSLLLLLAIAGIICWHVKRRRVAKWIGFIAIGWFWMWTTSLPSRLLGIPLEKEFLVDGRVPLIESYPKADAIVLLGGSMGIETNLSNYAEMSGGADRVWQAARLWKAGKAPVIIATSAHVAETTVPLLNDFGVPQQGIMILDEARNTEEEARIISKAGVRNILLVTSAWHMRRARLMFQKYAPNINVVCAPADFEFSILGARPFSILEFVPNPAALNPNSVAAHEWIGLICYTLFR